MYCPGCATQNVGEAKFCRGCGLNLTNVALAVTDQSSSISRPGSKRTQVSANSKKGLAVKKLIEGSGLIAASTLVGAALGIFSNAKDWIVIWLVFGAWLAVVGTLSIAKGIGILIELKYFDEQFDEMGGEQEIAAPTNSELVAAPTNSLRLTPVASVTESTTQLLNDPTNEKP